MACHPEERNNEKSRSLVPKISRYARNDRRFIATTISLILKVN
jgi:hypothetical protein